MRFEPKKKPGLGLLPPVWICLVWLVLIVTHTGYVGAQDIILLKMESRDKKTGILYSTFTLTAPQAALAKPVDLSGIAFPATILDNFIGGFYAVDQEVTLRQKAIVSITYTEQAVELYRRKNQDFKEEALAIVRYGKGGLDRDILPSTFDPQTRTVSASISSLKGGRQVTFAIIKTEKQTATEGRSDRWDFPPELDELVAFYPEVESTVRSSDKQGGGSATFDVQDDPAKVLSVYQEILTARGWHLDKGPSGSPQNRKLEYRKNNLHLVISARRRSGAGTSVDLKLRDTRQVHMEKGRGFSFSELIAKGDMDTLQKMVQANKDLINKRNEFGDIPLNIAIRHGQPRVAQFLIENGADIHLAGARGSTPLHEAVDKDNVTITRLLLEQGADINAKNHHNETPMNHLKHSVDVARLLVEHNADVNDRGRGGNTALHTCMQTSKKHDLAAFLIQSGADVNALNDLDESAMHLALQYGNEDYVDLLIENGALFYFESEVRSSLHYAVMGRNLSLIDWVFQEEVDVNLRDPNGNTPLHLAVFYDRGELKIVDYLVRQKKAELNIKNNEGKTPVDIAKTTNHEAKQYFEKLAAE